MNVFLNLLVGSIGLGCLGYGYWRHFYDKSEENKEEFQREIGDY